MKTDLRVRLTRARMARRRLGLGCPLRCWMKLEGEGCWYSLRRTLENKTTYE